MLSSLHDNLSRRNCDFLTQQSRDVSDQFASGLLHSILVHGDDIDKLTIELAAQRGSRQIIQGLKYCLQVGDIRSRMDVCKAMHGLVEAGRDQSSSAIQILIHTMENDPEWVIRFQAAEVLKVDANSSAPSLFV